MENKSFVVFLDVDGVLNSQKSKAGSCHLLVCRGKPQMCLLSSNTLSENLTVPVFLLQL